MNNHVQPGQVRVWTKHSELGLTVKYFVLSKERIELNHALFNNYVVIILDTHPRGLKGLYEGTQVSYPGNASLIDDSEEVEL